MKLSHEALLEKLDQVDHELLELWVEDEGELSDDEKWALFVVMLERRVKLLQTCIQAALPLSKEQCMPRWLERLTQSRQKLRLREIKILYDEIKRQKKIAKYEKVGRALEDDTL